MWLSSSDEYAKGGDVRKQEYLDKVANYLLENSEYYSEKAEELEMDVYDLYDEALEEAESMDDKSFKQTLKSANSKFANGGGVDNVSYEKIYEVLKENIDESIDDLGRTYENSSDFTGEEIEHKFRDGFIPYTNGGYELSWYEYISTLNSTGYSLPTEKLQAEMQRHVDYAYELAKDSFKEEYPEIVEELGEENIDYNSLYEAGYSDEAEQLSEWESEYMSDEDTIRCSIIAYYYEPTNDRGQDGKHTISLQGDINLEAPYHRKGKNDDFTEIIFTFDSMEELKSKLDDGLKNVIDWFNGSKPTGSDDDSFAKGGNIDEIVVKSGNNGKLKVVFKGVKNQKNELQSNEVFEEEKSKGKSVFLFVNDELYDEFIADEDEDEYAKGGGVKGMKLPKDAKIRINYVDVSVYKDSYEEGETDNVNNYDMNHIKGSIVSPKELVSFLAKNIYTSEDASDYSILDNNIHTSQLQDADGSEASQSEIERWKKGDLELYSANFIISVSIISEIDFDDETLSSITGIGVYKKGGKVKSKTPKMVRTQFEEGEYEYAGGGRVKVGIFDENQLRNKEDKKAVEKAQKETGLKYVDTKIKKKGGKMFLEVYLVSDEEYYNSSKFAKGGGVDDADWIEESLIDLQNETGFDDLVVNNSDSNSYEAGNGDAEFLVFETEDDARERAVERVKEDLEENPEYFNRDWLMNYVDAENFFTGVYDEWNESYVNDIESEDSDKYGNRLIEEMVDNGIVSNDSITSVVTPTLFNVLLFICDILPSETASRAASRVSKASNKA
jgi:6-pyruvoyl-tetrahydropterin synthase